MKTDERKIPTHLSAQELAEILTRCGKPITEKAIRKQAQADKRNKWGCIEVTVKGGKQKRFAIVDLPAEYRKKVYQDLKMLEPELAEYATGKEDSAKIVIANQIWERATEPEKDLARARAQILHAWEGYLSAVKSCRSEADFRFGTLYNQRQIVGLDPQVYERQKTVSRSGLHRWRKRFEKYGLAGLISDKRGRRGKTSIPLEQQQFILGTIANNPLWHEKRIAGSLKKRFDSQAASPGAVRRFLDAARRLDPALFTFLENPDKYKSTCQFALGNASEKAHYFMHYGEMDSTPTDVVCEDGKRYTIIGYIDIFSRKAKFQVVKTSNRWGIAALLRRVIWEWGLPENIITDHGKDYESKQIREALLALRIETPWIPPFDPKSKPHIERMFRTLAHGLEERLPGYIGHNREERRAIEARRSFADRLCKRGDPVECGLSWQKLQETIDRWTEDVYHQRLHTMIGMTPNAKAASTAHRPKCIPDIRALDRLLAEGGVRTIGKKGLRYNGGFFWADELIPYNRRKVLVRVDMQDAGRLICIDPDTKAYICTAVDMAISGIAVADKIKARKRADKRVREAAKARRKVAQEAFRDPIREEMRTVRAERATIRNLNVGDPVGDNPFVDAAMAAAEDLEAKEGRQDAQAVEQDSFDPEPAQSHPQPRIFRTPLERFRWLLAEQQHRGITDKEYAWIEKFRGSWETFVETFWRGWPKGDQQWVRRIAPDLVPVSDLSDDRNARRPILSVVGSNQEEAESHDDDEPETPLFADFIEKFHWLQEQQRQRRLTADEEDWLRREIKEWRDYAEMCIDSFSRGDQVWLARIAPHIFGEYAVDQVAGDFHTQRRG